MKQTETNEFVAQGAATWQEREEHDRIMKALDNVRGFVDSYFYINGNCYYWSTKPLPEEEALAIAQRGRHDEIMYMIHQYGRAKCPGDQQQHLHHVHTCLLPQSVQVIIARRNNREEMDAFLLYNGFEELGQDIVLDREDHEEIMRYVDRHGFKLKQQRRLKQRGNKDEIGLHIARHGLADELLDEMFDEIAAGGSLDEYYQFIERNQFRPTYQRRMLQTVGTDAFKAYADRYGLWEEVHGDLIEYRLPSEVMYYLRRHCYLSWDGEKKFARKARHEDKAFYVTNKKGDSINSFLWALFTVRPLEYDLLTECFLKLTYPYHIVEEDVKLMQDGSHQEVMERIEAGTLDDKALTALFFRNNPSEFEAYLDKWLKC